jgi:hemolysin activation/secretion protein
LARRWAALAVLCAGCVAAAGAAAQAGDAPRFEIRRFVFDGATLLPHERLQAATAPYSGAARDFGHVQRALEAVARLYDDAGFGAVQVLLPEQDLARGEVRLRVIEARVGRVLIEGNRHFDAGNIRASLPALAPGAAPNLLELARSLRLANENPAKRATLLLRAGREEDTVDAAVRVSDEPVAGADLTLDNSGAREPGRARLGAGYRHANLFGGDEVLRLHLAGGEQARIAGAGLRVPLYGAGGALELIAGDANVDAGKAGELFGVTGAGTLVIARYAHLIAPRGDLAGRLVLGWEYRAYDGPPRTTVRPVSLAYEGTLRRGGGETEFSAGLWRHAPAPDYSLWRWSLRHHRPLGGWQLRLALAGQATREALAAGERFGLGGADSVRGFDERALADDRGNRGSLELAVPLPGAPVQAQAFYDWGSLRRNRPAPGEPAVRGIAAAGFGLRGALGARLRWRVDWARVLDAGGAAVPGQRVHASLTYATLLP